MPTLSMQAARDLEASFEGRITSTHDAQSEFRGTPTILIPATTADVERALQLARAAERQIYVRSGRSVAATDLRTSAGAANMPPAVVVSMEAFDTVDIRGQQISAGAAATVADIAEQLSGASLFLPLDDNPSQSIASAVLSMDASPFLRSGVGRAPLRDAVVEAEVIPTEGADAGRMQTLRDQPLRDVLAGTSPAVISRLVFDAAAATTDAPDRWVQAWMTAYKPAAFAKLCDALVGAGRSAVPENVDVSIRVTSAAYSMMVVIVRATGHGAADDAAIAALVQTALRRARLPVLDSTRADGAGDSVAAWVATGPNAAAEGEIVQRFGSTTALRPYARFRQAFLEAVDYTIGANTRTRRERAPGIRAWAELQLAPGGRVAARAAIGYANPSASVAQEARRRMSRAIPADTRAAPAVGRALVRRGPGRAVLRGVDVLSALAPTPGFELQLSAPIGSGSIPNFTGDVIAQSNAAGYRQAISQYAVSSYAQPVIAARMTPRFVAVPENAPDVVAAVTFAAQQGLRVVTRSGGHQYCGLSSGGNDTLLLDMARFTSVQFSGNAPATNAPTQVTVGPGVALQDLSPALRARRVTIPHGECPLVRLGGHVQTGGIGHQLRSLGATLDWVRSFKMVTRDPQAPGADVYVERTFTRPPAGGSAGAPTDADVFRAVLGGGPGSWGVVTEITFDLVADGTYPQTHGYSSSCLYNKAGFDVAMQQFQAWAARQAQGTLPLGMDFFLTVVSGDIAQWRPAALVVETMCTTAAGVQDITTVVNAVESARPWWVARVRSIDGRADLSLIADHGVRDIGTFGLPASGREFDLPYKKTLYTARAPFTPAFRAGFVNLVDAVTQDPNLKVVVQAVIGGGAFSANGQHMTTHMQRRDAIVQLVFDVFYMPGFEAAAESFRVQMQQLLPQFSGGQDLRMLWGTFEDANTNGTQLDMSRNNVQSHYYDSPAEYARLQQIKNYTDPRDIFHTSFTIQV